MTDVKRNTSGMADDQNQNMTSDQGGQKTQRQGSQRFTPQEAKKQGKKGGRARVNAQDDKLSEEDIRTLQDTSMIDENI